MIPAIIPLGTQLLADFGVGYIVHGGVRVATCTSDFNLAQKACVGIAELAIMGAVSKPVNEYIDTTFDKVAKFIVDHDLDKKFMKGEKK